MNLFRNIIGAFMALFVLAVAVPASAKTLQEIDSCKDAALMAAPFTGTIAKREVQARHLDSTDTVLIDGEKTSATRPIWNLCEGPSLKEQLATANARIASLERLAYTKTSKGPVSWKSVAVERAGQITDLNGKLDAAKADIGSQKVLGKLWLTLGLLLLAVLVVAFYFIQHLAQDRNRLQRRFDASKPAPPKGEPSMESTLGKINDGPTPDGRGSEG